MYSSLCRYRLTVSRNKNDFITVIVCFVLFFNSVNDWFHSYIWPVSCIGYDFLLAVATVYLQGTLLINGTPTCSSHNSTVFETYVTGQEESGCVQP